MRTLLFLSLVLSASLHAEETLDLKSAEKLMLDYNFAQKANKASVRAAHEVVIQKYSDILPNLNFATEWPKDSNPQHALVLKQNIPYTPQWFQEKKVLELSEAVASQTVILGRQTLLNSLQKLYFKIQFLEEKKKLTLQSFTLVDQFKKESNQRYSKGFIGNSELKRSFLQALDLERVLLEVNAELESSKQQFLVSLGQIGKKVSLTTQLGIGSSFLKLTEKELRKYFHEHTNQTLAISQLESDSARIQSEASVYRYFPTVNLKAEMPVGSKENSTPTYSANLTWNIFAGGSDRAEQRRLFALKEQAEYTRRDSFVQFASDAEKMLGDLVQSKNSYIKLKEGLKIWEEIVAANQDRFQKGLISSKDLSDDINNYINYATSYYQETFDLIVKISDFCLLLGKEDLFHTFMS